MSKKAMLIIMDGWGKGNNPKSDAISYAHPEFVSSLYDKYPNSELITCGEAVGLPEGQMGNSEVGHLNLGAGRIVYQELQRVNVAIKTGELENNAALQAAFAYAKSNNKTLHFIGLVSDGGVHAHIQHLEALCHYAQNAGLSKVAIHAFTDGRDCDPKSGHGFIAKLQNTISQTGAVLASICGRYYAMDRDKRWERVQKSYDAMVHGRGIHSHDALSSIEASYAVGITDEFIEPIVLCDSNNNPLAQIQEGDAVVCFNFRTDRCREITEVLTQVDLPEQHMMTIPLHYVTLTEYDKSYKSVNVIFQTDNLSNTMGEVLAANGKTQIRIAETEKYPHVTFFFSGGREALFEGEKRIMRNSPKDVATYDLKPEMSAHELKDAIIEELRLQSADFVCMNFANADMVGHTGVWDAVVKAVKTVDECVSEIIPVALSNDYAVFLTADHGNSDNMVNEDNSPNTQHSLNPVPLFLISKDYNGPLRSGKLGDIAPTMLYYMNLPIPAEMTGNVLID
ncbi:MAG: 2,3-bisphosphoglycerate-independent phosphoglycerate mutase [Chitinophagaceae bacterium]|nr:2,3-bisphosphoglycerate-independent phosphoglycerate mutase [Chitinophagaceae bacterium]